VLSDREVTLTRGAGSPRDLGRGAWHPFTADRSNRGENNAKGVSLVLREEVRSRLHLEAPLASRQGDRPERRSSGGYKL